MSATTRTVRRLRLRAHSAAGIQRAVVLFSDALRTASLPDDAGRLTIVRKLALGRIDSRVAPQVVALQLERAFERLAPECVYAGAAGAPAAAAVWFRDALDAHTRLAFHLIAGAPVDEWYWPLAVRAWEPGTPLPRALRAIMFSLAALPEARTALPHWAAALAARGHAERLVVALRIEDVPPLARAAALRVPAHAGRAAADVRMAGRSAGPAADDPRRELLASLLTAAGAGVESARNLRALHATTSAPAGRNAVAAAQPASADGLSRHSLPAVRSGIERPRVSPPRELFEADTREGSMPSLHAGALSPEVIRSPLSSPLPWVAPDSVTHAGGLLFLIAVLERLGYPEWLETQPGWAQCAIAQRVFAAVLARLRVAPGDPAWRVAHCPARAPSTPRRFVAPARWRDALASSSGSPQRAQIAGWHTLWDASGRLLLGAWRGRCPRLLSAAWRSAEPRTMALNGEDCAALVTTAWLVAARRWLRRSARIGLADLVLRPGIQSLTPTHADLRFEMSACKLSLRRSGLDFDPGWVPWFGRVVAFHYR